MAPVGSSGRWTWVTQTGFLLSPLQCLFVITDQRHLVLLHVSPIGSLRDTRRVLGRHAQLFKQIMWCKLVSTELGIRISDNSLESAMTSLAAYFLEVSRS